MGLFSRKKFVAVAIAGGLAMGAGGIAAAFVGASGSGTGHGATTAVQSLNVSTIGPTGPLGPGLTQTVNFTVTNPNAFAVKVTKAIAILTTMVSPGGNHYIVTNTTGTYVVNCSITNFTLSVTYGPGFVTPGSHTVPVSLTMVTKTGTQLVCMGHEPRITLTIPAP